MTSNCGIPQQKSCPLSLKSSLLAIHCIYSYFPRFVKMLFLLFKAHSNWYSYNLRRVQLNPPTSKPNLSSQLDIFNPFCRKNSSASIRSKVQMPNVYLVIVLLFVEIFLSFLFLKL